MLQKLTRVFFSDASGARMGRIIHVHRQNGRGRITFMGGYVRVIVKLVFRYSRAMLMGRTKKRMMGPGVSRRGAVIHTRH
jgi:hypothetical protein